ncbi:MAG: glycosyltransferase [Akkermansiaceae bacterium]
MLKLLNKKNAEELIENFSVEISSSELNDRPLVSVCIITFNHLLFIEALLDSVLSQRTEFSIEILIGDDASTDGSSEIIDRYQRDYPDKIRILRSTENLFNRAGNPRLVQIRNFRAARGKYVAMLDGDDFWIDEFKLQKQVNYLESNPTCAGCFTDCQIVDADGQIIEPRPFWGNQYQSKYNQQDCISSLTSSYSTATLLWRKSVISSGIPGYFWMAGSDFLLDIVITEHGTLDYIPEVTACYRIHDGGIWQGSVGWSNSLSMIKRLSLLYLDRNLIAKHQRALDGCFRKWSSIYSQDLSREHTPLYESLAHYLTAIILLRPVKKSSVACAELTTLFRQRWRDNNASSRPLPKRLYHVFQLFCNFSDVRWLCLTELCISSISFFKRRFTHINSHIII